MCRKKFLTRWATAIAFCLCVTAAPSALADNTPACVAKVSAYVAELDQLLSTKIPWYLPDNIGPYDELQRKYFPFGDCDGDPILIEATKSRFLQDIGYNPRSKKLHCPILEWVCQDRVHLRREETQSRAQRPRLGT
jgi:hypothetical protein